MTDKDGYDKMSQYTGFNKILKSEALQSFIDKMHDGTIHEFIDDWKWIFSFSKKYRWIVFFYTVVGIITSTLGLGSAYIGRELINIVVEKKTEQLGFLIAFMLGMTAFSLIMSSVSSRISTKISIYVNNDIQAEIFDKIIDAKWKDLSQYKSGDLLNRFNGDVGTISANAIGWIPNLIISIYTFIVTFIVLFRMDATMAWIAILSAPFLLLISRRIMRKQKEYRKRVLELNSGMMSFEVETFFNFDMIKSFGVIGYYSRKLRAWQQRYKEYNLDYNKFQIKTNILLTLIGTAVTMLAFGYCLFRLWTGEILYGDMTFFLQQRSSLSSRFNSLVGTVPGMLNSAISAHRVRELVELPREEHDPKAAEELAKVAENGLTIHLDGVSFGYVEGQSVYDKTDLIIRPGEIVAVLASSGGGKTTLMRMLLGMIDPQEGSVTLSGADGAEVPVSADLRRFFSYVPQGNTILSGTIRENMKMVREDVTDEEIIEALKTACAWEFVEKIGLDGVLEERGRGVSEGQAQRLSIARALIRGTPILLLDEATSALDLELEQRVIANIMKADERKIIIVSTHRPGVLKLCHTIYRVEDGKIRAVDKNEEMQRVMLEEKNAQNEKRPRAVMPMPTIGLDVTESSETGSDDFWKM